jgi:hypothetical protein
MMPRITPIIPGKTNNRKLIVLSIVLDTPVRNDSNRVSKTRNRMERANNS